MRKMQLTSVLAVTLLVVSPGVPVLDVQFDGAAFAKGNGNGGGNGGGNSGGGGGGGGGKAESKKSEKAKGNSTKSANKAANKTKKVKKAAAAEGEITAAKGKPTKEGELAPNELGKMNGAMNANINAVLAHIRNGQITNGPVGLLAGLAVADAGIAAAEAEAAALEQLASDFGDLNSALEDEGFGSPEEYLEAKANGEVTEEQMARIDPLVEAVGGTDDSGLALAKLEPTEAEIQAAQDAAADADAAVGDAEQAILDAWNKDGDGDALLTGLRDKLEPYQAEIDAAVAESQSQEETAEVEVEEEAETEIE